MFFRLAEFEKLGVARVTGGEGLVLLMEEGRVVGIVIAIVHLQVSQADRHAGVEGQVDQQVLATFVGDVGPGFWAGGLQDDLKGSFDAAKLGLQVCPGFALHLWGCSNWLTLRRMGGAVARERNREDRKVAA